MKKLFYPLILTIILLSACGKKNSPFAEKAAENLKSSLEWRDKNTGVWETAGWWNSANLITAVIRYSKVTGDTSLHRVIDDMFTRARNYYVAEEPPKESWTCVNFINEYYDDEGWWALAWIDAYNLIGDKKYLEVAQIIFDDLLKGIDTYCDGGVYWKKTESKYKNSISNSLFSLTAARLYKCTGDKRYLEWFERNMAWFLDKGLINTETYFVEDGLGEGCVPNRDRHYTYNQGTAIGALTEMYLHNGDKKYLELAGKIADATINGPMTTENGILREVNPETDSSGDGVQFKGVFIRHLALLNEVTKNPAYKDFIIKNAESIITDNYDAGSHSFGYLWYGPFEGPDSAANSSALECVIEALALTK